MNYKNVKVKRVNKDAVLPTYGSEGAAGFDLYASEGGVIEPGETKKMPLGLAFEIPQGYELQIRPRSGVTSKTKLRVQLGTVDADYRGEVCAIVDNYDPVATTIIPKGYRICQGVISEVPVIHFVEVDELSDTKRGTNGFGSTGV